MRIYKIKTHFYGKDLNKEAMLGYAIAENEESIYGYINEKYKYGEWPECVEMTREEIVAAKGDYDSECMGEFYDQRYGWEDLGEVSVDDIANLKRMKILSD